MAANLGQMLPTPSCLLGPCRGAPISHCASSFIPQDLSASHVRQRGQLPSRQVIHLRHQAPGASWEASRKSCQRASEARTAAESGCRFCASSGMPAWTRLPSGLCFPVKLALATVPELQVPASELVRVNPDGGLGVRGGVCGKRDVGLSAITDIRSSQSEISPAPGLLAEAQLCLESQGRSPQGGRTSALPTVQPARSKCTAQELLSLIEMPCYKVLGDTNSLWKNFKGNVTYL